VRVLVTPQFNSGMQKLDAAGRKEAVRLFAMASGLSQEQLVQSPLLTKLDTSRNLYTLRGQSIRLFCTLDSQNNLLFVDVKEAIDPQVRRAERKQHEITLFGPIGDPQAYIASTEEDAIYSFTGEPLAYVDNTNNVYGFNGRHLGWFEDGVVWDHAGHRVGFTSQTCPVYTKFEPFKGFKQFKPFKAFKQHPPYKPHKSLSNSKSELISFLRNGR
jgi:hypothetical protein